MHPADLRWAWGPCRRRVLRIGGRREARRERGRAPAVDPCRWSADGPPTLVEEEDTSNKREPEGLEAWFRPLLGPGPGRSASWTAAEPRLRGEQWRTTPWGNWISWVPGRTWLTLDPGRNDSRD
ncbi:hypothetical protein NDU88_010463 [Pleurodeles waltl]|uniref:Uncharacterized protein n=1 Tax=Pleurodeles waltl TaxID=8319 RepID=A0AAV7S0V6_PLEWA|nr:hypothetical protein NDU88_010463 [Pleurodeles waltl]